MSLQRHFKRDEVWFVSNGECKVKYKSVSSKYYNEHHLKQYDVFKVAKEDLHQIFNPFEEECRIIEIQYGEETSEEDIERLEYYEGNNE
jgi:mannose-6-phosphate isomerase-like protein (cupin superfamily)